LLEKVAWRTPAELYDLAEQGDRDAKVWMVTPAADRRAKVEALTQVRRESVERLASVAPLATLLEGRGVGADAYVRELQQRSNGSEPLVVIDARR
jgi:DNA-binding helix-hairpin-helix protein with protein kinase domain